MIPMRLYVKVSGTLFALLALVHVARMLMENMALARDPFYLAITALAAGLSVWAFASLRAGRE
jgi:hypothetical protein